MTDRNKRSVELNLREDPEALLKLAETADALVESFRPGVMERLGLGYEALAAVNPKLVYVSISGYGADGPRAKEAGHDINYLGRAGVLSTTPPAISSVQIADLAGGSLLGVAGLLAALVRAQRTGEGDHVDIAMTDGAFALQALALGECFAGQQPSGLLTGRFPCYALYECADGRSHHGRRARAAVLERAVRRRGRPDLRPHPVRPGGASDLARALPHEVPRRVAGASSTAATPASGPVNDLSEAIDDPQLRHRADGRRPGRHAAARHADQAAQPPGERPDARAAPG